MEFIQQITATLEDVSTLTQTVEAWLQQQNVTDGSVITLALQELCVNIVEHAYAGVSGTIDLHIELLPKQLTLTLTDNAMNQFVTPENPELPNPLDLPEGGWGLALIYQIIDVVQHQNLEIGNRWTLIKYLGT